MAASRCPNCDAPLTATEAAAGVCPDCSTTLTADPPPTPVPEIVLPEARPARSWRPFAFGMMVGLLLALSGTAAAWRAWGPFPLPAAATAEAPAAEPESLVSRPPAENLTQPVEVLERARAAAERADADRAAAEQAIAVARDRLQVVLGEVAAAEAERSAAETRLRTVQGKEAEGTVVKARTAIQQADAQRAATERALADAQARLQAAKAKEDHARQAEAAARTMRADAERDLTDARNKLQTTRDQQAEADRQFAAARSRLQGAKDQAAAADRELADRKTRLVDLDRTIQTKAKAAGKATPAPTAATRSAGEFVRDWLVVGPFPAPDRKGHSLTFPPEGDPFDLEKNYRAGSVALRWRYHASAAEYVDFAKLFTTEDPAVAYAVCWVRSDRARKVVLSLGSNDGIRVWVGGKQVADVGVFRSASPGQDRATCDLSAGWNEVRVKIDNQGGPWGFYFEVRDPATDKPAGGLRFSTNPQEVKGTK
jgi:hypothetical protein